MFHDSLDGEMAEMRPRRLAMTENEAKSELEADLRGRKKKLEGGNLNWDGGEMG